MRREAENRQVVTANIETSGTDERDGDARVEIDMINIMAWH